MTITGISDFKRFASRMTVSPSMPGIFRSTISRSYGNSLRRSSADAAVGRGIDVVFGERECLRQQVADARLVVDDENARTLGRRSRRAAACRRGGRRGLRAAARPLAVEPGVDVAFAEAPLPADAHSGNLAGFDQPVNGAQIDLEVREHLLGR